MQQNARLLCARAINRTPLRCPRLVSCLSSRSPRCLQRRCLAQDAHTRSFLGHVDWAHLGGRHYFQAELPNATSAHKISAWKDAIAKCLPAKAREYSGDSATRHRDICLLLIEAQRQSGYNLLFSLASDHQRWDDVAWIVDYVAQRGVRRDPWDRYSQSTIQFHRPGQSLHESLGGDAWLNRDAELNPTWLGPPDDSLSLSDLTTEADPRFYDTRLQTEALGQIWQCLGLLIVRAIDRPEALASQYMPRVLTMLAALHHHGIVPSNVYTEAPQYDRSAVQQPPLLQMLSSNIMTALSDADWQARQAARTSVAANSSSFWNLKMHLPGTRSGSTQQSLRPEVWLELVLWSCLRGPWVVDGFAILKKMFNSNAFSWSLVSWGKLLESSSTPEPSKSTFGWREAMDLLEGARPEIQPRPSAADKQSIIKTISSEVVAAYIDAMISQIHVGVGARGTGFDTLVKDINLFGKILKARSLSLAFASWDAIIRRLNESGGLWLERSPNSALKLVSLAQPYGREEEAGNLPVTGHSMIDFSYFFTASALSLNILHRVLNAHAKAGDLDNTLLTYRVMQDFNEANSRRSIEEFFAKLNNRQHGSEFDSANGLFSSNINAADYPSFFPQLPIYVLARVLQVAQHIKDEDFKDWIFNQRDAIGPLVPEKLIKEPGLAPALAQYASSTGNSHLMELILTYHSRDPERSETGLPSPILEALLRTLIEQNNFAALERILDQTMTPTYVPLPERSAEQARVFQAVVNVIPTLLSRLANDVDIKSARDRTNSGKEHPVPKMIKILTKAVRAINALPPGFTLDLSSTHASRDLRTHLRTQLHIMLGLFASMAGKWFNLSLYIHSFGEGPVALQIPSSSAELFNTLLPTIIHARGLARARAFWDLWCAPADQLAREFTKDAGIFQIPSDRRRQVGLRLEKLPDSDVERPNSDDVIIRAPSIPSTSRVTQHNALTRKSMIRFSGRIRPDLASVRIMKAALDEDRKMHQTNKKHVYKYNSQEMRQWLRAYVEAWGSSRSLAGEELLAFEDVMDGFEK